MPPNRHILLATLGGQPQVVTFTLDLLLKAYPISEVIVLHPHTTDVRLARALSCLAAEFRGPAYYGTAQRIAFRSCVLQDGGQPIDDIVDDQSADVTLNTIHHLISELKRDGQHIHLSVTGGRRMIALLAISVATLHFDRHDHIWHIYTPPTLQQAAQEGALMHAPTETGIKLIKGPFLALGAYIAPADTFRGAQEVQRHQMEAQERAYCASVEREASRSQVKVLQAFAQGMRPQAIADALHISLSTVNYHKTALLQLCRNAWNIEPSAPLDYHFLHLKFAPYYQPDRESIPENRPTRTGSSTEKSR